MKDIGPGCREIRARTPDGAFRTFAPGRHRYQAAQAHAQETS